MDWAVFIQGNATIKVAGSADQIETAGLPVVTLVRLVDIGSSENKDLGTERVPLDLGALGLEEGLLTCWETVQRCKAVDLDAGRLSLYAGRSVNHTESYCTRYDPSDENLDIQWSRGGKRVDRRRCR